MKVLAINFNQIDEIVLYTDNTVVFHTHSANIEFDANYKFKFYYNKELVFLTKDSIEKFAQDNKITFYAS